MALLLSSPGRTQAVAWILLWLLPPASLQPGKNREPTYAVRQPPHILGILGGSVDIPFSFYFPWKLAQDPQMTITWRWKHFHGNFFYNSTPLFIHEHFKNRVTLNWTQGQTSGSLRIRNLCEKDEALYFCRIQLKTKDEGPQMLQSLKGTTLTITHDITQSPTTAVTTAAREDTGDQGNRAPSLVDLGATAAIVVATAVLITPICALMIFLRWKKRPGD